MEATTPSKPTLTNSKNFANEKPMYIINGKIYKRLTSVYSYATKNNLVIVGMYQPNRNKPLTIVRISQLNQTINELNYLLNK